MTEQEKKLLKDLDRILCEFADPDIPYEEQSAPMLDSSWSVAQQILKLFKQAGYVQLEKGQCIVWENEISGQAKLAKG